MDISVVITLVAAALLIQLLLPHPRFVKAHKEYDLPDPVPDPPGTGPVPVKFSLLVPLRYEPDVDVTLRDLLVSPRRDFEILLLVGVDDPNTGDTCAHLAQAFPDRVRVVENTAPTMAAALNTAIRYCNGDVVGVIEGGDTVRASLLDRVDGAYRASGADIVRVAMDVADDSTAPHLYWLMDGMVCVRGSRPVRLTKRFHLTPSAAYFVRTDLLRISGGWDGDSRTEELELLLRLRSFLAAVNHSLWAYLRSDTKVLSDHFDRSRREPPKPRRGAAPHRAAPEPDPPAHPDLLAVAESPDTPAAVESMATGLDALFRALGPPPESLRLAEAGPTPQGDGGASDG
ncbi:glycosyltransferase family 2 protein [Streptomyces sp. NPDC048340]|uniref:glycosyltransferase family 2 protein n=1 Tax=Streptomyces sp. NPDC048340 TaxID=3365537 RepID=UPI0037223653